MKQEETKPIHEQIIDAVGGEDRFREIAGLKPKQDMKQTAVEWLVEQISYTTTSSEIISYHKDISKLVEQAKEMEREQLAKAESKGADEAVESLWKMMNDRD
jgi:hypothetical protein